MAPAPHNFTSSFVMTVLTTTTMATRKGYSAALAIPCLPPSHPAAPSPPSMALPLHPHQERALHRCLLIEQDGSLSTGFNALPGKFAEYKSRGGVLADAVGTGKTATIIALVLAGKGGGGATLVVAPSHLIPQWKAEVAKASRCAWARQSIWPPVPSGPRRGGSSWSPSATSCRRPR